MLKRITKSTLLAFVLTNIMLLPSAETKGQTAEYFKEGVSPQVALMNRYGSYPVDLSNGLADVSIPLYTLQTTAGLSVPLQLKFHASGLRADEREGLFGVRWALSGGGHVSRIIKGYPDEYYPFNPQVGNPDYRPDFNTLFGTTSLMPYGKSGTNGSFANPGYLEGVYWSGGQFRDTEYDIYSYSLPSGRSGKFILRDVGGTKTAFTMPYEPLKIFVMGAEVSITDEDGTTYRFGEARVQPNQTTVRYVDTNDSDLITTWHLSSITSANKLDVVQLDYKRPNLKTHFWNTSLVTSDELHDNNAFSDNPEDLYGSSLYLMIGELLTSPSRYFASGSTGSDVVYSPYTISSIQYRANQQPNQRIDFAYEQKNGQPTYLNAMTVYNGANTVVKSLRFSLKNNLSGKLKLLDGVEVTNASNPANGEKYRFDYYDSASLPSCGELAKNSDWWGYYSANAGWFYGENISLNVPNSGGRVTRTIAGGNKQSDVNSMRMGMLRSIRYPTGGKTEFEYEGNQVGGSLYGGLRIKRLSNTPVSGKVESKSYEYNAFSVPGYLQAPQKNLFVENEVECYSFRYFDAGSATDYLAGEGKYIQRVFLNRFPSQYTDLNANIVSNTRVTEYLESGTGGANQKTVFEYNTKNLNFSYYNTDNGQDFEGYEANRSRYKHGYVSPTDFWRRNRLISKTVYQGSQKLKEYVYEYNTYNRTSVFDLPVYRYRAHNVAHLWDNGIGAEVNNDLKELSLIYPDRVNQTFAFKHQEYTSGADKLIKETERTYHPNGSTTAVVKEFGYDPEYLLPTLEKISNSNGDLEETTYKYPFNCPELGSTPYNEMVSNHLLSPVIVKEVKLGANNSEKHTTHYRKWANNAFYPSEVLHQQLSYAGSESLLAYTKYTSQGRPLYLIQSNGAERTVYLWSYNHQYPVAAIQNATYEQVVNALPGGETFIAQLADKIAPSDADFNTLRALGSSLPASLLSTCTYRPLVGKLAETDPSGVTTYYEYDAVGRLKEITINEGGNRRILKSFDYHYANQ